MTIALLLSLAASQDESVADCIRRLGDDAIDVREAAEAKLKARGRGILPELELAAKTQSDFEIRTRISHVIQFFTQVRWHTNLELARRKAAQEKKPLLVFSTMGPLDGFV